MSYQNFAELIGTIQSNSTVKRLVVAAAQDEHTLEAVFRARRDKIVDPYLIGNPDKIREIMNTLGESLPADHIIAASSETEAARIAVDAIRAGKADILMKGKIETADLMRAVINKEQGLRTKGIMSMVVFHEMPSYHKLLAVTDGGMVMYPNLDEKKMIVINAVDTMVSMGYDCPKVAVLAAVEKVNPKMPETVDADLLRQMNRRDEISNCVIEGPLSYDIVMSPESAAIKGFHSPVVGDADLLVVPNITTGNVLGKCLQYSAGAKMAGIIVGAQVPIVLTSRGASSEEKYLSLALSAVVYTAAGALAKTGS